MAALRIVGGRSATGDPTDLVIDEGRLGGSSDPLDPATPTLDAGGLMVSPGFVDLQVNGGFGNDFTQDPMSIWTVGDRLATTGVTSFCPTIITGPHDRIEAAQEAMRRRPDGYGGAEPIGLHLEGPHLAVGRRGTHPAQHLTPPADARITTDGVTIVTLAPELPGALSLIGELVGAGVVVSIGHSEASAQQATAGIDAGATMGTHVFNAMPPITAREPGIAGVLLADDRTWFSVISDGHHLDAHTLTMAYRVAPHRIILITDAIAAAGMPDGRYHIGSVDVEHRGGAVRNDDGRLAGAAATMDEAVAIFAATTGAGVAAAIRAATTNPADAIGRTDLGRFAPGARGDVALLDGALVVGTVVGGRIVHLTEESRLTAR